MSPHILYVAWGFPPARSGGVYRALATANAFAAGNARVTVLTAERTAFEARTGTDPSLEDEIDPRVEVVRLPFSWPPRPPDGAPRWDPRALPARVGRRAHRYLDQVPFPESVYGRWAPRLRRAAERIHRADPVDLVVATANPNVDFAAALALRRHGVGYVLDYRDAWLLDVFTGRQLHPDGSRAARLEADLVAGAREIWFVNPQIRAWHAARYPEHAARMHVVANGYDPRFAPIPVAPGSDAVRFGYIGTITGQVPLRQFLAGWRLATETDRLPGASATLWGYLGFYDHTRQGAETLLAEHARDGVRHLGPVAKTGVRDAYAACDALLLILGSGRYVTSGKVYEYMASGLPIVSVHEPGNAADDVLADYPRWFPVADLGAESIARALAAAADVARNDTLGRRREAAALAHPFERDLQLAPRVAALLAAPV